MVGISSNTPRSSAIFVVPPRIAALFVLLVCWGAYSEDHAHLEHHRVTEEEFASGLPPHEQTLFRLAGHAGVTWGYTLTAAGVIALGAYICRPGSLKKAEPSASLSSVNETGARDPKL